MIDRSKVVTAESLWSWVDQISHEISLREENAKDLGAAGQLVALEESGFRRALQLFIDQVLDDDGPYLADIKAVYDNWAEDN